MDYIHYAVVVLFYFILFYFILSCSSPAFYLDDVNLFIFWMFKPEPQFEVCLNLKQIVAIETK